jgi:L-ascorbate metabolism protein UlaG (beta-lactamase superfamily)
MRRASAQHGAEQAERERTGEQAAAMPTVAAEHHHRVLVAGRSRSELERPLDPGGRPHARSVALRPGPFRRRVPAPRRQARMPGPMGAGTPDRRCGPWDAQGVGRLTYVGHATVLIELDGVALLTDPLLRERFGHVRRIAPPVRDAPRADAILVSHAHRDHLDLPSLARLPRDVPILASRAAAEVMRGAGRAVTALAPGERVRVGAVEVVATRAIHDGRRTPVGRPREAIGFLVCGSVRLYFAGDTDLFDDMRALSAGLDVALLPIWGWGAKVGPGHLDPERAARAAGLLRPRVAVPIHWGAYASPRVWWRSDPGLPAREFERLAAVHAPGVAVSVVAPGRTLALAPAAAGL